MTSLATDLARPESSRKQLPESSRTTYRVPARPQRLVVIVPAHNEEKTIGQVIANIPCTIDDVEEVKVVVVNDCSTDRTADIAREAGAIVVSHPNRHGVGAAFMTGIDAALRLQADVIVNMDGDGQFDSQDISKLIRPILYESHGFVTCTRFADPANSPEMPRLKLWGNRMMCRLINLIIRRGKFTDVSCGFRAYSRETALRLNLYGRFTYTQESFIDLASKGILMTEIPLRVRGTREFGKSKVASNLFWYTLQTVPIMARAVRDVRPLTFFGTIGLVFLLLGCTMFGFVGVWWLIHERTSPWTSLLTIGSGSLVMGLVIGFIALIADQIGRGRRIDEQLLYYARVRYFKEFADDAPSSPGAEARPGSHEEVSPAHPFEK
ncbi:MAG: DPM/DPG synthase family glycosyltransferase [Planctomycetaceae bacterium]